MIIACLSFISCEVKEGVGGTGKISGYLFIQYYNSNLNKVMYEQVASSEEVFIQYGDQKAEGDRVRTNFDGYFEFPYLYQGNYTLYYYTKKSISGAEVDSVVILDVVLGKGEHRHLGELYTHESLDFDDGTGKIAGSLNEINYYENSIWPNLSVLDTSFANDKEIYLRHTSEDFYRDRKRSSHKGYFMFEGVLPGNYTIYYYSDNYNSSGTDTVFELDIILGENESKQLGALYSYNAVDHNDGIGSIKGRIREINYFENSQWPHLIVEDTINAQEKEVYLKIKNEAFYKERIRTSYDGTFQFERLIPGDYEIFTYSENLEGASENEVVIIDVSVKNDTTNIGDIFTHNL